MQRNTGMDRSEVHVPHKLRFFWWVTNAICSRAEQSPYKMYKPSFRITRKFSIYKRVPKQQITSSRPFIKSQACWYRPIRKQLQVKIPKGGANNPQRVVKQLYRDSQLSCINLSKTIQVVTVATNLDSGLMCYPIKI